MLSDGPFIRPHPAIWRIILAAGIAYLLLLVFLVFQDLEFARYVVSLIDPSLGVRLREESYIDDCSISWANIMDKMDFFVFAHLAGWIVKALILRDIWICWIISVGFEICEYSLQHQLPNFSECWWDHWILDAGTCNALGIYLGMKICNYFHMKTFQWSGQDSSKASFWHLFRPASWTPFSWAYTSSFKNYLISWTVVFFFLVTELNIFYLKNILWIPASHPIIIARTVLIALLGFGGVRQLYDFSYSETSQTLGSFTWLFIAMLGSELLVTAKFGIKENLFSKPFPDHIKAFWGGFGLFLVLFPLWKFFLKDMFRQHKIKK